MQLIATYGKTQIPWWKRPILRLSALLSVSLLAGLLAYRPALRSFDGWRARRSLARAERLASEGKPAEALLSLRIAVQLAPLDRRGLEVAAVTLETLGSPDAIAYRSELLTLDPSNETARAALVRTALRFRDLGVAENALAGFHPSQRNDLEVERLGAAFSGIAGNPADHERDLVRILKRHPTDDQTRLELATLRLREPETAEDARTILRKFASSGPFHDAACRELAVDALDRHSNSEALHWANCLVADSPAAFENRLFKIHVERRLQSPSYQIDISELQRTAEDAPAEVADLATLMMLQGDASSAAMWLANLPSKTREAAAVRSLNIDVAVELGHWATVREGLRAGDWGPIPDDVIDDVLRAHELELGRQSVLAQNVWNSAVHSAQGSVPALNALYRLSLAEKDPALTDISLRALASTQVARVWASKKLLERAYTRGDTTDIKRLLAAALANDPNNLRLKNDWAYLVLLTTPERPDAQLRHDVQEVCDNQPNDVYYNTTRALLLWRDQNPTQALQVLEHMPPEVLHVPGRALLFGALLAATGHANLALPYLKIAQNTMLLPEEKALLDHALALAKSKGPS